MLLELLMPALDLKGRGRGGRWGKGRGWRAPFRAIDFLHFSLCPSLSLSLVIVWNDHRYIRLSLDVCVLKWPLSSFPSSCFLSRILDLIAHFPLRLQVQVTSSEAYPITNNSLSAAVAAAVAADDDVTVETIPLFFFSRPVWLDLLSFTLSRSDGIRWSNQDGSILGKYLEGSWLSIECGRCFPLFFFFSLLFLFYLLLSRLKPMVTVLIALQWPETLLVLSKTMETIGCWTSGHRKAANRMRI